MKKISGLLIVAIIAFTIMTVGAASAAAPTSGALTFSAGTLTYPYEAAACCVKVGLSTGSLNANGYNGPPPGVVGGFGGGLITFTPWVDLPSSTRIIFTLTNATFGDVKYWLLDSGNISGATGLPEAATTDTVSGSVATFVVGLHPIPAGSILYFSTSNCCSPNSPSFTFCNATVGTTVTLKVTQCYDDPGAPEASSLTSCISNGVSILSIYQEYAFQVNPNDPNIGPPVVATIDDNPRDASEGREQFCLPNEGCPDHNGGKHTVRAPVGLINQIYRSPYTWRLSLADMPADSASIDWTLMGAQFSKLAELYLKDGNHGNTANFSINSDTNATLSIWNQGPYEFHDTHIDKLVMEVDGTSILGPQDFLITGALNFYSQACFNNVSLSPTKVITWDINAWQGTLPYMYAGGDTVGHSDDQFIKIFNNSALAAAVTVDVATDDGTTRPPISLGEIGAGATGLFWASSIASLASPHLPLQSAFTAVFTVAAPIDTVTAMSVQKRASGGERVAPVYTGKTSEYKQF